VLNIAASAEVTSFEEKPTDEIGWINGGFFVLEPKAIDYIEGDSTSWELAPLRNLARTASSLRFSITASGNRATRCATSGNSRRYGKAETRLGRLEN